MHRDLVIRDARVIDGTGAPWFSADVRVSGSRIAAVAPALDAAGAEVVEAGGRYLAPGFIDAHCHDDLIVLREPQRVEKASQGVTTIVVGNCSFSLYPAVPASAELLRLHFSGIVGETHPTEIFSDIGGYREALHKGIALNVVSLVGHAALRLAVMGYERRPATPAEIGAMQDLLAAQLAGGAAGLSLGLVYPPSAYAEAAELRALAETVQRHGKIVTAHIRNYEAGLLGAIDEFVGLLEAAKVPGLLSHLQSAGRPNWGQIPSATAALERARSAGVDVSFDMYPYPAGSTYILQLLPPEALEGGLDGLLARLRDAASRESLRRQVEGESNSAGAQSKVALIGWDNVRISGTTNPALKPLEGKPMTQAAASLGLAPFDLMVKLIEEDAGQTSIILFQLCDADLHAACSHRLYMVGSDGLPRPGTRPHPRAFGTFPRLLGPLVRDAKWFSLEDAVRKMTSVAAQRFGLADRGLLRPGLAADLVLFDAAVEDKATFDEPTVLPSGIDHVWVAGEPVVADGRSTGRLPGRLVCSR